MKAFVAAIAIVLLVVFAWAATEAVLADCRSMTAGCFLAEGTWFYSYQTLITGLLAFGAALALLEVERQKRQEALRNEIEQRKRDASGILQSIGTQIHRMAASLKINDHEAVQLSSERILNLCSRLALLPGASFSLADWLAYQCITASAWARKMSFVQKDVGLMRQRSVVHLSAMTSYLANPERFISELGEIRHCPISNAQLHSRFEQVEIDADNANLHGFIYNQ